MRGFRARPGDVRAGPGRRIVPGYAKARPLLPLGGAAGQTLGGAALSGAGPDAR